MIKSWHWVLLAGFASSNFKPTFLPDDNPTHWTTQPGRIFFFFDTSLRGMCYIAPKRCINWICRLFGRPELIIDYLLLRRFVSSLNSDPNLFLLHENWKIKPGHGYIFCWVSLNHSLLNFLWFPLNSCPL